MKKLCLFLLSTCSLFSGYGINQTSSASPLQQITSNKIIGTIAKNTTETQFEELISYFKKNDLKLDISEVNYNEQDEIIGIKILLQKGNQKKNYSLQSNIPIPDLELGSNDDSLFIKTKGAIGLDSLGTIMSEFTKADESFNNFLSENPFSFLLNSNQFKELLNNAQIDFEELSNDFLNNLKEKANDKSKSSTKKYLPKYSFINNSNINKLIIIDGKESNFETLNKLATTNKLNEVDNLKASTAVSLYGKKAKDGAIIATTKKH